MTEVITHDCRVGDAGRELTLHIKVQGCGPPLVLLHGFTGSTETLLGVAEQLQSAFTVYRVDLVGHGRSSAPLDPQCYTMAHCLRQLCAALDQLGVRRAHWLGYSMGARVCLSLCAAHPERVCSAVLIGGSAGIEDAALRRQRVDEDRALAQRLRQRGIEDFVEYWMALPLFASQRRLGEAHWRSLREQRLSNRVEALAASLLGMGCGSMPPLHAALPAIDRPLCLVVGETDTKFRAIAEAMRLRLPRAELAVVEGAGHAAHVERPQVVVSLLRQFYQQHVLIEAATINPAI